MVHEAYIKLAGEAGAFWSDRNELFKVASIVMRHLIVDYARRQQAEKRGGGALMVTLNDGLPAAETAMLDVVALDDALLDLPEAALRGAASQPRGVPAGRTRPPP